MAFFFDLIVPQKAIKAIQQIKKLEFVFLFTSFLVSVAPHNDHGAGDGTDKASVDESGASSVTLIVVIVLVLVLAIVVAVGTVFYAKKNKKWCFAVGDPRNDTIRQPDPEIQAPLNQEDPKARPIIKHKYSRPE